MKPFKDYETTKSYTEAEVLPVGGYVLKILDVKKCCYKDHKEITGCSDDEATFLKLSFDIAEGEYTGFYHRNFYDYQTGEDKKWKGTYKLYIPQEDGSERDGWTKRRFKTVMEAIEDSNAGFQWEWDETRLKDKLVGGIFNRKEYSYNGKTGFFTQCYGLTSVESIKKGKFKQPADIYLDKTATITPTDDDDFMKIDDSLGDEFPFR